MFGSLFASWQANTAFSKRCCPLACCGEMMCHAQGQMEACGVR